MIANGVTGFYDQNTHCILMDDFPPRSAAQISEYKAVAPYFYDRMRHRHDPARTSGKRRPRPDRAQAIAMHGDDVVGTRHRYGKGEAVWLPSLIELGVAGTATTKGSRISTASTAAGRLIVPCRTSHARRTGC